MGEIGMRDFIKPLDMIWNNVSRTFPDETPGRMLIPNKLYWFYGLFPALSCFEKQKLAFLEYITCSKMLTSNDLHKTMGIKRGAHFMPALYAH